MRVPKTKNTRFVVDLGSLKLDDAERDAISAAIQGAVLSFLGTHRKMPSRRVQLLYPESDQSGPTAGMILEPEEPDPEA
jgi:hypothetical protein